MLEMTVSCSPQQVLVAGRPSRSNTERNTKPPDRPKPSDRRQEGQVARNARLTPLSISYEKLLPMIQGLFRLQVARPIGTEPIHKGS
ncbi:hypothetical protein CK203_066951 [Vitis vinifera]|uniref:Uncharacterized protein n=1 Tax=Vitis vinifera TaxID=29760 RepID=A0A438F5J0_VITVI|nr:hypothetical protein CK203_066951 [Vitis vinifera]